MNPSQLLDHLRRLASTLTPRQIATLAVAFVGVVAVIVGSAYYVNTPSYALLFSDLDAESAASVVARLKTEKVPYVMDEGGRAVRVDASRVDELRLGFASQGLPTSGRIGFEIFDRTAFGTTDFLEHVNYRRALEGELARTISTIAEVSSARVHIAMAKDSLFTGDAQPAKASVVLKLRSHRPPSPAMVAGITGLVAASVESLRPEAVVVVDTSGRPLSQPSDSADETAVALPLEKQRQFERDLTAKVVALLEPVIGEGRVRVNVSARLNGESEETTEERWDPTTVIRSQQTTADGGSTMNPQGVAGARANAPPTVTTARPPSTVVAPTSATRMSETTNYEVSKVTKHTIVPRGRLSRLSVAVVLDDDRVVTQDGSGEPKTTTKPRTPEDLKRIQGLVAAAVGLDPARGDQITVENIAFDDVNLDMQPPAGGWWMRIGGPRFVEKIGDGVSDLARAAVVLVLGLVALFAVLKPMARRALRLPNATLPPGTIVNGVQQARTVADLEGDIEAQLDAAIAAKSGNTRRMPALTKRISKAAEQEPEHVARLVRSWLAEEER